MPKRAQEMTALAVSRLKEPGFHFVGGVPGLAMQVLPTGGRSWILRLSVGGKRRDMGLGGFPDVPLAEAREAARKARLKVRDGIDPIDAKRTARNALRASIASSMTFKDAGEAYIAAHQAAWKNSKHRSQWTSTLETYAYPVIGALGVQEVELPHILKILELIWTTKTETATRLRGRIELILDWATARGYRNGLNPARWRGHLDKLLARPAKVAFTEHHPALPASDMGVFLQRLKAAEGVGARALEFVILTAARSGEVRGAKWTEIDLQAAVWVIPKERMKAGKEHRVPLSPRAVELLAAQPPNSNSDFIFQAARGGQLSDMTLTAVLRRLKVPAVPHGFRSTFRDWASEQTSYPHEVCEMALAHSVGNKVEAAYRRGDLFAKRRRMMADWAMFCSTPARPTGVVPIRGNAR